jgi:L-fuconate dehydratase
VTHAQPAKPTTITVAPGTASLAGARIVALDCYDVRFPTSLDFDGSDAMNPDPDYSAAYAVLRTDAAPADGAGPLEGHAVCFTIGRGNEVMVAAVQALRRHVVGRHVADIVADLGGFSAAMTGDSQLRWLGPEKGVMHMAIGAVVNAAWDLAAKVAGKPAWRLLADMTPAQIVGLVDFRYLEDALSPAEALGILQAAQPTRAERASHLEQHGYPAYTTTPGWIGYSDDKLVELSRQAVRDGFTQIKLKVGADASAEARHPDRRGRQPALGDRAGTGVDRGDRAVGPVLG